VDRVKKLYPSVSIDRVFSSFNGPDNNWNRAIEYNVLFGRSWCAKNGEVYSSVLSRIVQSIIDSKPNPASKTKVEKNIENKVKDKVEVTNTVTIDELKASVKNAIPIKEKKLAALSHIISDMYETIKKPETIIHQHIITIKAANAQLIVDYFIGEGYDCSFKSVEDGKTMITLTCV
jgi:hypothetical protein